MLTVKDILNLKIDKNKKITMSAFTKDYTLTQLSKDYSILDYAFVSYSNSEGFELTQTIYKDRANTFEDMLNVIKENNLQEDEQLIYWDMDDCGIFNFTDVITFIDGVVIFL